MTHSKLDYFAQIPYWPSSIVWSRNMARLNLFEINKLRSLYSLVNDRGVWRKVSKEKIYSAGHVSWTDSNNPTKRVLLRTEKRRCARSKLTCVSDIESDLRRVDACNWKTVDTDRYVWQDVFPLVAKIHLYLCTGGVDDALINYWCR